MEAANLCIEVRRNEFQKKEREWMNEKDVLIKKLNALQNENDDQSYEKYDDYEKRRNAAAQHSSSVSVKHANFIEKKKSSHHQQVEKRLRLQINTIENNMLVERSSHKREITILKKELQLEQNRVESLAREINLLRSNDTSKYKIQKIQGGTKNMVAHTMSSLKDRIR